ncbi:MAG: alkaline phosphatase D family protein [Hyphomonadaceae bacterium]|nr:alkaline phosphatase D family protein [Hyphomonadaceae bacterium]
MTRAPSRREVLAQAAALAAFPALAHAQERPLQRIAFGACARQTKAQPIWTEIAALRPDLFIALGDNIYADAETPERFGACYAALAAKPEFAAFRAATPIRAIWDDHDYGANDGGADYPLKHDARAAFCDFWNEPADSPRRTQEGGIFTAETFGPPGRRVQIILPDLRWNRTALASRSRGWVRYAGWALQRRLRGLDVPGPYGPNPDPAASLLGDAQWRWLEAQFAVPADLRIVCSSIQVLADKAGWEGWENFPGDYARLMRLIGDAPNVVVISGDVHFGEVSRLERAGAAPLIEITSSGLTEVWPVQPPNGRRVGAYRGRNFGMLHIDWDARSVTAQVRDRRGSMRLECLLRFG